MTYEYFYPIKKIFVSLKKYLIHIAVASLAGCVLCSLFYLVTNKTLYSSSSSISSVKSIGPSLQQTISDVATGGEISLLTQESLESQNILHSNGKNIEAYEIKSSISCSYSSSSYVIKFNFKNADKSICQKALQTLTEIVCDYCSGNSSPYNDLKNSLIISENASTPTKEKSNLFVYSLLGFFGFLIASVSFCLIKMFQEDRIVNIDDTNSLEISSFLYKFKNNKTGVDDNNLNKIINFINYSSSGKNDAVILQPCDEDYVQHLKIAFEILSKKNNNSRKKLIVNLTGNKLKKENAVELFASGGIDLKEVEYDTCLFDYLTTEKFIGSINFEMYEYVVFLTPSLANSNLVVSLGKKGIKVLLSGVIDKCRRKDVFETNQYLKRFGFDILAFIAIRK